MKNAIIAVFALALLAAGGCASAETHAQKRRAELLATYPVGTTTRADVLRAWHYAEPELIERRPKAGWDKSHNSMVAQRCIASERRTGKRVDRVDRYSAPDGMFSICYQWFYYDAAEHLVDVDWERGTE